ncbi:MAG: hypothetical protein LW875_08000 [Proteobacteria bacterium]|nr:hypothetical protein [Pseudomonadota bacterium]
MKTATNREKRSDRKLLWFVSLALLAQVLWLFSHMGWFPGSQSKIQSGKIPAGFVREFNHDLKIRDKDSLVWSEAEKGESLYFYDSLLTLSQSTATLYLHEQTEIHLSENTLVTIEPQTTAENSAIRLKFMRGDLKARNPFAKTAIETENFTLNIDQGTELALKSKGDSDFELEVLSGKAELNQNGQRTAINQNEVLKIDQNKIADKKRVSQDLKWLKPVPKRIYSRQNQLQLPVQWQGDAQEIQIVQNSKETTSIPVETQAETTLTVPLEQGKATLRLVKGDEVSPPLEVEIWKAPNIQLLSPYPRDRASTLDPVYFRWSKASPVETYEIRILDQETGQSWSHTVTGNNFQFQFEKDSDLLWSVRGFDREGFEIPEAYRNELYLREKPLEAPKLKSPQLRKPAHRKADEGAFLPKTDFFLAQLFFKKAFAQTPASKESEFEAVFEWESVDKADHYIIELSADPLFQNTLVREKVKRTEYSWKEFRLGTFYWRVAAGSKTGRLGLFSEPQKIAFTELPQEESFSDGVILRKRKDPAPPRADVDTSDQKVFQDLPKKSFDEKRFEKDPPIPFAEYRELKSRTLFEVGQSQFNYSLEGESDLSAKVAVKEAPTFRLFHEQLWTEQRTWAVDISYSPQTWKEKDPILSPFQPDLQWNETSVQLLTGQAKDDWLYGFIYSTQTAAQRVGLQEIEVKTISTLGASVLWQSRHTSKWHRAHQLSFSSGASGFQVQTQNSVGYKFGWGLGIGIKAQGQVYFLNQDTSSMTSFGGFMFYDLP